MGVLTLIGFLEEEFGVDRMLTMWTSPTSRALQGSAASSRTDVTEPDFESTLRSLEGGG